MKNKNQESVAVVHVGTYPPRECGIATFSFDLIENIDKLFVFFDEAKVVAMNSTLLEKKSYPEKVIFEISENNCSQYEKVAEELNNMSNLKVVSIQHEFGIFGNNFGENILVFLEKIQKPVVITMHTVLPNPEEKMKEIVIKMIEKSAQIVVMTKASKDILVEVYKAPEEKIKIIPHGIHPLPYTDTKAQKTKLGFSSKKILSTFGLLGRGKGIENAILAMRDVVKKIPNALYLIIGATHPVVLKNEGEAYRESLEKMVKDFGLENNVIFYNQYYETSKLLEFLQATDIYLALSQNPHQAVSGTLSYALGAGRPVIATPFAQAKEIVTEEVGALVDFGYSSVLADKIVELLSNESSLIEMGKKAYFRTRGMIWPNVALSYMKIFSSLSSELARREKNVPHINLNHLKKLSTDVGILQFSVLNEPDFGWGYTLDDNARALVALSWYYDRSKEKEIEDLALIYISFLEKTSIGKETGFQNYMDEKGEFSSSKNLEENLDDANARALWALAEVVQGSLPSHIRLRAEKLFMKHFLGHKKSISPRSVAFYVKALSLWSLSKKDDETKKLLIYYSDFLLNLYSQNKSDGWYWFEPILTYSNGLLPEALFYAYSVTQNQKYFEVAKESLDFLIKHSFDENGVCVPVGQAGWFAKGGTKKIYDQQPEEVSALVLALKKAYEFSKDASYFKKMHEAFDWFLGNNLLSQVIYSFDTGGCFDGLGQEKVNLNQGAESTISYLLARLAVDPRI